MEIGGKLCHLNYANDLVYIFKYAENVQQT